MTFPGRFVRPSTADGKVQVKVLMPIRENMQHVQVKHRADRMRRGSPEYIYVKSTSGQVCGELTLLNRDKIKQPP
jgi:hypothetical protein